MIQLKRSFRSFYKHAESFHTIHLIKNTCLWIIRYCKKAYYKICVLQISKKNSKRLKFRQNFCKRSLKELLFNAAVGLHLESLPKTVTHHYNYFTRGLSRFWENLNLGQILYDCFLKAALKVLIKSQSTITYALPINASSRNC